MNPKHKSEKQSDAHLFNVDLLVESGSAAEALELLLRLLNKAGFADYRIKSGVELGRLIETLEAQAEPRAIPVELPSPRQQADTEPAPSVTDRIKGFIANNTLIRITVNKGFGIRLSIPCRLINLDESTQILTVYHVDEKQVYTFSLNEIDDFT
ncbi:hypothetical protein [Paenibacillus glycinis]|uniref:Uncharacterized protein n=1 Tax=Paenibacillus glycinis TaxID=2697035 RepID=A0ABW9XTY1_9BACL|nr:hypothetical protein [Paenibacillus glycinis]NBD26119.1 hypothetical protein [Paenibacillus glycinis]